VTYGPGYYFSGEGGTSANGFQLPKCLRPWFDVSGFWRGVLGEWPCPSRWSVFRRQLPAGPFSSVRLPSPQPQQIFWPLVVVGFSAVAVNPITLQTFDVSGEAKGFIEFDYFNGAWYVGSGFQEIPEPGTLTLIATGLFGLSVRAWRSRGTFRR
jgi:PEP-CTERM motif